MTFSLVPHPFEVHFYQDFFDNNIIVFKFRGHLSIVMGKPRNFCFVSFSDKETLKQLFVDLKSVSDPSKTEEIELEGAYHIIQKFFISQKWNVEIRIELHLSTKDDLLN